MIGESFPSECAGLKMCGWDQPRCWGWGDELVVCWGCVCVSRVWTIEPPPAGAGCRGGGHRGWWIRPPADWTMPHECQKVGGCLWHGGGAVGRPLARVGTGARGKNPGAKCNSRGPWGCVLLLLNEVRVARSVGGWLAGCGAAACLPLPFPTEGRKKGRRRAELCERGTPRCVCPRQQTAPIRG